MKFHHLRLFLILTVITGIVYPVFITVIGGLFFSHQAHGSLITDKGQVIGSELIARHITSPQYFWPRPSAGDYATMPSGASNLSWSSGKLKEVVQQRREALWKAHNLPEGSPIPADLLFASGSGLEPFISREAADFQTDRVAKARNLPLEQVRKLVASHTVSGGILGETVVNVMTLNAELDKK